MSTRKNQKSQGLAQEWIARVLLFLLLGGTVYWSTLLGVFAVIRFASDIRFFTFVFLVVTLLIPVFAWLNLIYYIRVSKKERIIDRWTRWIDDRRDEWLMTVVLTAASELILVLIAVGLIDVASIGGGLMSLILFPTTLVNVLLLIVAQGTDQYVPALSIINDLGFLLSIYAQMVFFYYFSRFIFWAGHLHAHHAHRITSGSERKRKSSR